ncbi:DUF447 domain-containing protein [Pseudoxanthobacter sp.]|uniref:DUF447 domain-containing protein n=1 Tax=Pseudoxanthobacter sp. TaxID=1925742 RepID=UPI002FE0DDDD
MTFVLETVLVTVDAQGLPFIAPFGLQAAGSGWLMTPFRPSPALENLRAVPFATACAVDDVRIFAGCVTGRREWPTVPADTIAGARLAAATSHMELKLERFEDDALRPRLHFSLVHEAVHGVWRGYNRARAAVIEGALLVARLDLIERARVEREMAWLAKAVEKTGGAAEREAWNWLAGAVEDYCRQALSEAR